MLRPLRPLLGLCLALVTSLVFAAPSDVGIILMHGKWDQHPFHTTALASALEGQGYRVEQPTMTWGGARNYDADYTETLQEIDALAKKLREAGAKRILVGGMSFGANGAIAYASRHPVDGILAIAPGHLPDNPAWIKKMKPDVDKARALVNAGNGDKKLDFTDPNSGGRSRDIYVRAKVFLSFFDPQGLGAMARSAAAIAKPVPVLVIAGEQDPGTRYVDMRLWPAFPPHPKNQLVRVDAGHTDAINKGLQATVDWVSGLGY